MNRAEKSQVSSNDRAVKFDVWTVATIVAASVLWTVYLSYTAYFERSADAGEHLRYVTLIRDYHFLPEPRNCSVCHHPPLYYGFSAVVSWVALRFQVTDVSLVLQGLSLVFATVYLIYATRTLSRFVRHPLTFRVGTALIAFWPSTVIAACRVHNDSLVNALIVAALYYLLVWYDEGRRAAFGWASLLTGLALLTKSSASPVLLTWLALVAHRSYQHRREFRWFKALVVPSLGLPACLGVALWLKWPTLGTGLCHAFLGRACYVSRTLLPTRWSTFLYFDIVEFLRNPFLIVGPDSTEQGYFWNCLLKSSLFGMYQGRVDSDMTVGSNPHIAAAMNIGLLLFAAFLAIVAVRVGSRWVLSLLPLLGCSVVSLALIIAFRASVPNPHHSDFRHVQSLVAWGAVLSLALLEHAGQTRRGVYYLGLLGCLAMISGSVVFFISPVFSAGP